jgi:hypothetical protein
VELSPCFNASFTTALLLLTTASPPRKGGCIQLLHFMAGWLHVLSYFAFSVAPLLSTGKGSPVQDSSKTVKDRQKARQRPPKTKDIKTSKDSFKTCPEHPSFTTILCGSQKPAAVCPGCPGSPGSPLCSHCCLPAHGNRNKIDPPKTRREFENATRFT